MMSATNQNEISELRHVIAKDENFLSFERVREFVVIPQSRARSVTGSTPGKCKQYPCPSCKYVTDRKNNLKRHLLTMHEKCSKLLECCDAVFPNKSALRQHVTERHSGAGYGCRICGRRFSRKALMKRHSAVHSGQREHSCALCDYATSHKSNLDRHIRRHQQRPLANAGRNSSSASSVSPPHMGLFDEASPKNLTGTGSHSLFGSASIDFRSHGYGLEAIVPCGSLPVLTEFSLLRQRMISKVFNFPGLSVGWSSFLGNLPSRHHGYGASMDEMVAMVTENYAKDAARYFRHGSMGFALADQWPVELKMLKEDGEQFHQQDETQRGCRSINSLRACAAVGHTSMESALNKPRDLSVSGSSSRSRARSPEVEERPCAAEAGRRSRLVPLLHTCSDCSMTFTRQLDLKEHTESSHPVNSARSLLKSITIQVKHAQRLTSGTKMASDRL